MFRLYPNKSQVEQIERTFGACRWVWNLALETKIAAWKVEQKNITCFDLCKQLTIWKNTVAPWLYEVSSVALQQTLRDLDKAYQNFFRRVKKGEKPGFPKFRSRYDNNQSYRLTAAGGTVRVIDGKHVKLPKLGVVRCVVDREVEGRILNATVRRVPSGKYFVSMCCTECPEPELPPPENYVIGIDVGIKDLMVRSDGVHVPNGRNLAKSEKKLRREQRRLSRKQKGSKNRAKQRIRVAKVHERIANQRGDAIHKATTQAIKDGQVIAIEDLNVKGMLKNHHLAKAVSDASMSEMHRQLKYKAEWYGREVVQVDRWFPSTQICSECGAVTGPKHDLSVREWTCPECGTHHDRDENAAKNLATEGMRILREE